MQWIKLSRVITYAACVLLAACGSEQNNEEVASIIDGSGAPVPDVAVSGAITGFGSVIVDGVHYQTDNAEVYINGELGSEDALRVGDFITLLATENDDSNEFNASVIYVESAVQGKVTSVDYDEGVIDVLNQRVRISGDTVFDTDFMATNISGIAVGDTLEVRGANAGSGDIYATRINKREGGGDVLSGRIVNINSNEYSLSLAGNIVDFSQVNLRFELANNQWVSVAGEFDVQADRFVATDLRSRKDRQVLAEGVVSRLAGVVGNLYLGGFEVNGQPVILQANTEYRNGDLFSLMNGAIVTIEGDVDAQGFLWARIVSFRDNNFMTSNGIVESIDFESTESTDSPVMHDNLSRGSITVDGNDFIINENTIFLGAGPEFDHRSSLRRDLHLGDQVRVVSAGNPMTGEWFARVVEVIRLNADLNRPPRKPQ